MATGSIHFKEPMEIDDAGVVHYQELKVKKVTGPWVKDVILHGALIQQASDESYTIQAEQEAQSETQESAAQVLNNLINRIPVPAAP